MIRLYDFELSGNAYKVRNLLSLLGVAHERVTVNLLAGAQRQVEGIGKDDPGAGLTGFLRCHRLDCPVGTHGHKGRGLDAATPEIEAAKPRPAG